MCPENEIRATPIGIVGTSGGFTGLVLSLVWFIKENYIKMELRLHHIIDHLLKEICPRGNNKVVIYISLYHDKCLLFMLELY